MADEEVDAVPGGSDSEGSGVVHEGGEVSENAAGSEHEDSGIVAAESADVDEGHADDPTDVDGGNEEVEALPAEDDGDETNDAAEAGSNSSSPDQEESVVITPPKFGDFLLRNSISAEDTGSDEDSRNNGLGEPAEDGDKDSNGVETVSAKDGVSEEKTVVDDTSGEKAAGDHEEVAGGEIEEVTGDSDSVVVSQGDSTEAAQESQEEDKEVEGIMANSKSSDKAEDSDSDIEMVEEIKKTDDDDDDDIQEVLDDDEEGATASTAPRAPRRKTQV